MLPHEENPWTVENLEEFLYFCCPECDERNQSKENPACFRIKFNSLLSLCHNIFSNAIIKNLEIQMKQMKNANWSKPQNQDNLLIHM